MKCEYNYNTHFSNTKYMALFCQTDQPVLGLFPAAHLSTGPKCPVSALYKIMLAELNPPCSD